MNEWINEWMTNKCGSSRCGPDASRPLTGPLCPLTRPQSREPCPSEEVPHCPQTQTSNVLRVQEKGSQIDMPECRQGCTLTQHMGWGFPRSPAFPTQGAMHQPRYVKMSSQCVMPSEKADNYPGPRLLKDIGVVLGSSTRARVQLWSLSHSASQPDPPSHRVLSVQPALNCSSHTLPWDAQGRLRLNKVVSRALPCELIGNFISVYPWMPGDPKSPTEW
jgi:hypothetical protein